MLSFFRRGVMAKVMLVVLFLSLVAIVITGFGTKGGGGIGELGGLSASTVASVGGESITSDQLRDDTQRQLDRLRQQQPELDMASFVRQGAVDQVLDQLIGSAAAMAFGQSVGFAASKRMVDAEIASIQAFQGITGQFDQAAFQAALQREKITEAQLRKDLATRLIEKQIAVPVAGSAFVPNALAQQYASLLLETRTGSFGAIPATAMGTGNEPGEQEIADFYRRNVGRYTIPERRVIRYATFGADTVGGAAKATDAEIQQAYNQNSAQYAARETRTLSQVVLPNEAAAKALQQKVASGTSFAQAAQEAHFGAADIAVGTKSKDEFAKMSAPAVANAVFAAAKGATVGPIRSGLGWHVVKIEDVKTIGATPLAAVRAELAKKIEAQKGQKALADLAAAIDSKVGEGASFEQVVKERGLPVTETPAVTAAGAAPENPAWKPAPELAALLKGAFQLGANEPPQVAPIVPNQRYALVSVASILAAAPPPLAKIQAQVKADLIAQRAADRAKAVGQSIVSKINAGVAPAEAFRQAGVALPPLQPLSGVRRDIARQGQQIPVPLQMLFTLTRGKARLAPAPENRGWIIVYLDKIVPGDASKEAGLAEAVKRQFTPVIGDEYGQQFLAAIRSSMKVRRNENALATLKGDLAGGRR